jgi:hypothetical protein
MDCALGPSPVVRKECKSMGSAAKSMVSISFLITSASHARLAVKSGPICLSKGLLADFIIFKTQLKKIRFP